MIHRSAFKKKKKQTHSSESGQIKRAGLKKLNKSKEMPSVQKNPKDQQKVWRTEDHFKTSRKSGSLEAKYATMRGDLKLVHKN